MGRQENDLGQYFKTVKVMLEVQLGFVEAAVKKQCGKHQSAVVKLCGKLECAENPYLCEECVRVGAHPHQNQLLEHNDFLRQMCSRVDSSRASCSEKVGRELIRSLIELKVRMGEELDSFKKEIEDALAFGYYSNPNILSYKLDFELTPHWLISFKNKLNNTQALDLQSKLRNFKGTLSSLVSNIVLDASPPATTQTFKKELSPHILPKEAPPPPHLTVLSLSDKKIYTLACTPSRVFTFNNKMLVCSHTPPSLLYDLDSKTAIPLPFLITHFSHSGQCFYCVSSPNVMLEFDMEGVQKDQFVGYKDVAECVECYESSNQTVVAVGYKDGTVELYSKRCRLYSERRGNLAVTSIHAHKDMLYYSAADGVVHSFRIVGLTLEYVNGFNTNLKGIFGITQQSSGLLVLSPQRISLIDSMTGAVMASVQGQIGDGVVCEINQRTLVVSLGAQLRSFSVTNTIKQMHILSQSPLLTTSTRNSSFIHNNTLWTLKTPTTDIEVYTLTAN